MYLKNTCLILYVRRVGHLVEVYLTIRYNPPMASHIFNDYFHKLQFSIRKGDAEETLSFLTHAARLVMEVKPEGERPDLIYGEFAHLMLGCNTNIYSSTRGYRTYKDDEKKIPIFFLASKGQDLVDRGFKLLEATE